MKKTDYEKLSEIAKEALALATAVCAVTPVSVYQKTKLKELAKKLESMTKKEKKTTFKTAKQAILPFVEPCTGCAYLGVCDKGERCAGFVYIKAEK